MLGKYFGKKKVYLHNISFNYKKNSNLFIKVAEIKYKKCTLFFFIVSLKEDYIQKPTFSDILLNLIHR